MQPSDHSLRYHEHESAQHSEEDSPLRTRRTSLLATVLSACALASAQSPLRPTGVAYDVAGNLYFADTARNQVLESTLAGTTKVIAGSGEQGFSGDGSLATAATLNAPQAIAINSTGNLYIADTANNAIRVVDPVTGILTTLSTALHNPTAIALDATGNLLIADTATHRILRLDIAAGNLTTIAGNGTQGFSGDNGPATGAALDTPSGIAVLPDGRVLIADTRNHRIRAVSSTGIITTFAGNGTPGFSGDNGPATHAQLFSPHGLTVMPDGTLLVADSNNHRIRAISGTSGTSGIITTIAGTGTQGFPADAAPVATATLDTPHAVAVSAFNQPTFSDHLLRALIDAALYTAASESPRTSTITLTATNTNASIQVRGSAGTPHGTVQLLDNNTPIAVANLTSANATIPLSLSTGQHNLTATYAGDTYNPAAASTAAPLTIGLTATTITLSPPSASYAGLPLTLHATVAPVAATGTVTFSDNGNVVASARLTYGTANGVYLAPTTGQHTILATYSGDANDAPCTSDPLTASVSPMPGFDLAVTGAATQAALNGATLTYTLTATADPAPFSGAVSFSASGLPANTAVTFAPPQVVPGATAASTVMSIPTDKLRAESRIPFSPLFCAALLPLALFLGRRRKLAGLCTLVLLTGCGTRLAPGTGSSANTSVYNVTITATGTNLAGALITHSTQVSFSVQ